MKILFKTIAAPHALEDCRYAPDYQNDSLFHGLVSHFSESSENNEVVDFPCMNHMYEDFKDPIRLFSLYKIIPQSRRAAGSERENIIDRIKNHEYDIIVCAIHHTRHGCYALIHEEIDFLLQHYPADKVAIVDGWDREEIDEGLTKKCKYFKREIMQGGKLPLLPIGFAIPESKFRKPALKTQAFSSNVPAMFDWEGGNHPHIKTYTFKTEEEYYEDMGRSYFCYNCKKAGWDTCRINEIIAAGSVPVFTDIENCPENTLLHHPKELYVKAKQIRGVEYAYIDTGNPVQDTRNIRTGGGKIDFFHFDEYAYFELLMQLREYGLKHLTTKALARRFLTTMGINAE